MPQARLMRSQTDKMFAGVCGGIGAYLGVDSVFVRLAFLLLFFASGVGLLLYVVLMIIMPSELNQVQTPSEAAHENMDQFGKNVTSGMKRARQHPQGPTIAAGLLIALGIYLLLNNLGWLNWLSAGLFWPLALIGLGLFLILRRSR